MPRYVILHHEMPAETSRPSHWDLMLETGQVLRTWAISSLPEFDTSLAAEKLADHRLAYLEYEGPISGDRGLVTRWDSGTFNVEIDDDCHLVAAISGDRLCGELRLDCENETVQLWRVRFRRVGIRGRA